MMIKHFSKAVPVLEHIHARGHAFAAHQRSQHAVARRISRMQRFRHGAKICSQPSRSRRRHAKCHRKRFGFQTYHRSGCYRGAKRAKGR